MQPLGTPVLQGVQLLLRPYVSADAPFVFSAWASDPLIAAAAGRTPHTHQQMTQAMVDEWVAAYQSPRAIRWAITWQGALVGDIQVTTWNEVNHSCELGFCLAQTHWGKGLMVEALVLVTHYLLHEAGFHRIALKHLGSNPRSGRVMQKAGYLYEGCLREARRQSDGRYDDLHLYAALATTWQKP